ncbi:MAG: hypothetical protein H0W83_15590 [Planctomycetes bacterium]|nr:hypothetical protein [Planctomycetota bacterium]
MTVTSLHLPSALLCLMMVGSAAAEDGATPPPRPPPIDDPSLLEPAEPLTLQPLAPKPAPAKPTTPVRAAPPDVSDVPDDLPKVAETRTVTKTIPADYGDYTELRLGLNLAARTFTIQTTGGVPTQESFDQAGGGTLRFMASPGLHSINGGLIYGIGLGWQGGTRTDALTKLIQTYDYYSLDGLLGYGLPFSRRVQLEILGGLGYGIGNYTVNHVADSSGGGFLFEISSNLMYTTKEGFQGGVHLGYSATRATLTSSDGTRSLDFSTGGLEGGFILGARF